MADADPILWSRSVDPADGIALGDDLIVVVGGEVIAAYAKSDGHLLWDHGIDDTDGPATVNFGDNLVIAGFLDGPPEAFDALTGARASLPGTGDIDASLQDAPPLDRAWELPPDYRWNGNTLVHAGRDIWTASEPPGPGEPFVSRFGACTAINDFATGLWVVDDIGGVLAHPVLGPREIDPSIIAVRGREAAVVTADLELRLLRCP